MNRGTIKFFNTEKGFGFIKYEGSDREIFVHQSGLIDDVKENDVVEFETIDGRKGKNAIDVRVVD